MTEIQRVFVQRGFRVGDKLPSERELAKQLSVGRSTLREAMQGLQTMGLVKIRHGVGTFFASEPGKWLLHPLRFSENPPHRLFEELIEARLMVEVRLAGLAAERATEEDIVRLRESLDKRETAERGEFNARGLDFHLAIAAAAHHTVLASMLTAVSHLYFDVLDSLGRSAQEAEYAFRARQQHGHHEILLRIEARDPQGAANAMRAHLRAVRAEFPSITEPSRAVYNEEEINE
jgi:GntR family transcriptional regulator, transcriptional repressor for pyruvate dehydrogenase complex